LKKGAFVKISLADAAPKFVAAALDLLAECEDADEMLVTNAITSAAQKLRRVIESGRW
jgi:hypothetical protein